MTNQLKGTSLLGQDGWYQIECSTNYYIDKSNNEDRKEELMLSSSQHPVKIDEERSKA